MCFVYHTGSGYCKLIERKGSQELLETKVPTPAAVKPAAADGAALAAIDPSAKPGLLASTTRLVKRAVTSATDRYRQFIDSEVDADNAEVLDDGSCDTMNDGHLNRQLGRDDCFLINKKTQPQHPKQQSAAKTEMHPTAGDKGRTGVVEESSGIGWANPFDPKHTRHSHAEIETRNFDVFGAAPFRKRSSVKPDEVVLRSTAADVFDCAPFVPQRLEKKTMNAAADGNYLSADRGDKLFVKPSSQAEQRVVSSSSMSTQPALTTVSQNLAGTADLYGPGTIVPSTDCTSFRGAANAIPGGTPRCAAPAVPVGTPRGIIVNTVLPATGRSNRPDSGTAATSPVGDRNTSPYTPASRQPFRRELAPHTVPPPSTDISTTACSLDQRHTPSSADVLFSPFASMSSSAYCERQEIPRSHEDGFSSLKRSSRGAKHRLDKDFGAQFANPAFTDDPDATTVCSESMMIGGKGGEAMSPQRQLSIETEPRSPAATGGDELNCLIPNASVGPSSHTVPRSFSKKHRQTAPPAVIPTSPTDVEPFSVKKKSIALL